MILANLVKNVSYGNSKKAEKLETEVKDIVDEYISTTTNFLKLVNSMNDNELKKSTKLMVVELSKKFNQTLKDLRNDVNLLDMKPVNLISHVTVDTYDNKIITHDYITKIYNSDRAKNVNIMEIAERLGLLIIPTAYVNKTLIEKDEVYLSDRAYNYNIRYVFNNFCKECNNNNLSSWLVCPIQYYDIKEHAKDLSFEFFVPSQIRQAFTSIKIILPMLIGMISQIEQLSTKVDTMSSELVNIRQTLIQQQQQINRLEEELTQQRIKVAEQAARERQMEEQYKAAIEKIQWEMYDPMLIALPKNITNINTYHGNIVLGPAWGPEIDPLLCDLLGLTKQSDRTDYINKEYRKYD